MGCREMHWSVLLWPCHGPPYFRYFCSDSALSRTVQYMIEVFTFSHAFRLYASAQLSSAPSIHQCILSLLSALCCDFLLFLHMTSRLQGNTVELPEEENTPEKRVDRIFAMMDKVCCYDLAQGLALLATCTSNIFPSCTGYTVHNQDSVLSGCTAYYTVHLF